MLQNLLSCGQPLPKEMYFAYSEPSTRLSKSLCNIELTLNNHSFSDEADVINVHLVLCACTLDLIKNTCFEE